MRRASYGVPSTATGRGVRYARWPALQAVMHGGPAASRAAATPRGARSARTAAPVSVSVNQLPRRKRRRLGGETPTSRRCASARKLRQSRGRERVGSNEQALTMVWTERPSWPVSNPGPAGERIDPPRPASKRPYGSVRYFDGRTPRLASRQGPPPLARNQSVAARNDLRRPSG